MKLKITAKELRAIGYPESPVIPIAMNLIEKNYKHLEKEKAFDILKGVLADPKRYFEDELLGR